MNQLIERIKNEPVIVVDLSKAILVLLISFGAVISSAQVAAIIAVVWCLLTFFTRNAVSPVRREVGQG